MSVVGADVAAGRWVTALLDDSGLRAVAEHGHFDDVIEWSRDALIIGVDIPIGLTDAPRRCDREARSALGPRASTVFITPARPVLEAPDYASARALAGRRGDPGVTAQAYNLRAKIFEVAPHAEDDGRIHEVHPELSFAAMANGVVTEPKTTWNGQMRRRGLLDAEGVRIPEHLTSVARAAPDDVLDAVAVAWSARRILGSAAQRLPSSGDGPAIWF